MHYIINVALNGKHFFATAEHSLQDPAKAQVVAKAIKEAFPADKGYSVVMSRWESAGWNVEIEGERS
jgi:hypothetical protein